MRIPVPLTSRPITLNTTIQCVIRTIARWRCVSAFWSNASSTLTSLIIFYVHPEFFSSSAKKRTTATQFVPLNGFPVEAVNQILPARGIGIVLEMRLNGFRGGYAASGSRKIVDETELA